MEFVLNVISDVSDSDISDYDPEQFIPQPEDTGDLENKNETKRKKYEH